jgi:heme/copper-type cytochrome/quinol oxidase subunit 2
MKNKTLALLSVVLLLAMSVATAQNMPASVNESAQILHQNGQIYLVVLVLATIFAGILVFLIVLERRLSKLEKEQKK